MAAYAATLSLINTINLELIPHPTRSFTPSQTQLMLSISQAASFFQDFLEADLKESQHLEAPIADAAYAAEDAISFNCLDQVLAGSTPDEEGPDLLGQQLHKVLQDMDLIKIEATKIKETGRVNNLLHQKSSTTPSAASFHQKHKMVGFDEQKLQVMEVLAGHQKSRQVIPIVGMGGSGKTTLARNVYDHKFSVDHFDFRAWVTVSQEYDVSQILGGLLSIETKGMDEEKLGVRVHQELSGRRYLVVLDDMWSLECWYFVSRFFPDNNNGSRIVVTTRLSNIAKEISTFSLDIKLLGMDASWDLFCEIAFGQDPCPMELEELGRKIARNCGGLPLALVVIGGLLKKSSMPVEYWSQIADDINATLSLDANELCSGILSLSYDHLPVYLKPCFLYISIFPEDFEIRASELLRLWMAEGFLRPIRGKTLEEIAENFLNELVERNLVLVNQLGSRGRIKCLKIHDLLRELSIRKAAEEKFLCVIGRGKLDASPLVMSSQHRVVVHKLPMLDDNDGHLEVAPFTRSLVCGSDRVLSPTPPQMLQVLCMDDRHSFQRRSDNYQSHLETGFQLVNSRYLYFRLHQELYGNFSFSTSRMRNIQTIVVDGYFWKGPVIVAPSEIWDMLQLRHLEIRRFILPDVSYDEQKNKRVALENLQTIKTAVNFRCSKDVVFKASNVRRLSIRFENDRPGYKEVFQHLQNIKCFQKLESLGFYSFHGIRNMMMIVNDEGVFFPGSITKLSLGGLGLSWEEDMRMIGSLPLLQVLKIKYQAFVGREWNPIEGEFLCLKSLHISNCWDLKNWNADSSHFPRLEKLTFEFLPELKEIPMDIGEIPTLCSITLRHCSESSELSAMEIQKEQQSLGNFGLQLSLAPKRKE